MGIVSKNHKILKRLLRIMPVLLVILLIYIIYGKIWDNHTTINIEAISEDNEVISCAVFDGKDLWEKSQIIIEDGVISEKSVLAHGVDDSEYLLIPGLIDAHAHLSTPYQMEQMVKNGVTTVCDVSASAELENKYPALDV